MARNYIQEHCLHFGLDFLVLYGTFKLEHIFDSINTTNSNYGELGNLVYTKRKAGHQYEYGVDFNLGGYNIFSYVKGRKDIQIPTHDAITFYGTAFKILETEEIDYYIQSYFNIVKMKRFDICMDIEDPIEKVWKKFRVPTQRGKVHLSTQGKLEGRGIGEYDNSKNRRVFIRLYNKIQDIKDSQKAKLYGDYLQKENITRVEIEVRRELARNIDYRELYNVETLKSIFKNYLRKHTNIFSTLSEDKISLYKKPKEINDDERQSIYYRKLFKANFLGYAKRIIELGGCPIRVLIGEGLFLESTENKLGKKKFRKIKRFEQILKTKTYYANRPEKNTEVENYE